MNLSEESLKYALRITYEKYENLYQIGKIDYDGKTQIEYALRAFIKNNSYNYFTKTANAREMLLRNTSRIDALKLICKEYNITNIDDITNEMINDFCDKYTDDIINNEDYNPPKM